MPLDLRAVCSLLLLSSPAIPFTYADGSVNVQNDSSPPRSSSQDEVNHPENLLHSSYERRRQLSSASSARHRRWQPAPSEASPSEPQDSSQSFGKVYTGHKFEVTDEPSAVDSSADMVYLLEHSDVLAGEHDTSNSAGIGIWTASDQGIYGVASQDLGYYIDIYLGSPSTKFQVQLDTASADTWVASTACTDCGINYGRRAALGADNSQSLVANTSQWTASYSPSYPLTGIDLPLATVEGTGAQDLLIFGGGLSTENFPFGLATGVSDTFSADEIPFLGVLGLGNSHAYPQLSLQDHEPLAMLLYNHGKIPRPQLGLALGKSADGSNAGQLAFGGIAPSKFQGDMAVMESVSNEGYWEVPISINSGSASIESRTGIVDTRSAVIWAPQEDVIKIFTSVDGAFLSQSSGLVVPCNAQISLSISIKDYTIELSGPDMIFTPVEGGLCAGGNCCFSTVQPAAASTGLQQGQWILGIPALRGSYIGLDYERNTIGFAAQAAVETT